MLRRLRNTRQVGAMLALLLAAYILPGNAFFCVHGNGSSSIGRQCACSECRELQRETGKCSGDCCLEAELKHAEEAQAGSARGLSALSSDQDECCAHFSIGLLGHAVQGKLRCAMPGLLFTAPAQNAQLAALPVIVNSSAAIRGSPPPPTDACRAQAASLLLL